MLVPIDTANCHPEVFSRVNAFAGQPGATVILLHVLRLNIAAPDNHLYEELCQEAYWHLEQLAREFLHPDISTLFRVRVGDPVEEILAEVKAEGVDLIVLPISRGSLRRQNASFWQRALGSFFTGVGEKLVRAAPVPLLVVHAEAGFNCQEHWGSGVDDIRARLRFLDATSGTSAAPGPAAQDTTGGDSAIAARRWAAAAT